MAPRPKTYGTRRSYVKPTGKTMNGSKADEPELELRRFDVMPARIGTGKEKDLGTAPKEEKQDIPSQGLGKGGGSVPGTPVGERAAISRLPNAEHLSTTVSPARSLKNRRMSAQDMLSIDTSIKELGSRRKSVRRSVNGSATSEIQNLISNTGFESIPTGHTSSSHVRTNIDQNGFTEDHQQSPAGRNIGLNDIPSDLHNLAVWVAQSISKHSDKSPLSAIPEPRQKASSPQPGQDTEMSDSLDNVEGVRITRGKKKKRLQQLKGKEAANDSKEKLVVGVGKSYFPRDAASIERRLKDDLNEGLKQRLFGCSIKTDASTNLIERNACGKLLFNTLVDMGDSANRNSAAVLKSALDERKDDTPFLSALQILASSPEIMAFINLLFSKDDAPQWETSNADESRPSTGVDTSGATTITETSGLTSRAGTSISEAESPFKALTKNKVVNKKFERQKPSQEVIPALEAATRVLVQIQQGEAGTDYFAPYASGSMIPNHTGQIRMNSYGTAHGPPCPDHPTYGMGHGPPVGLNLNNYASPYANPVAAHPGNYASPYSHPVNPPPANYASPYANPVVPNQASGSGVGSGDNPANKHDGGETNHDDRETHTPHQDIIEAATEANKRHVEAAGQDISNEGEDASKASKEADDQDVSNEKEETSKVSAEANGQGISNEKMEASNAVDLGATDVDDAHKQETSIDGDLTDDDLMTAKSDNQSVAPPAEDHKLFTGERLGDFTSTENIDWLLTMGNGGIIPASSKKTGTSFPSTISSSQVDAKIQTEVSRIIYEIMSCKDWRRYPGGTTKQHFYASAEGQRLAVELRRLMPITKLVVNTIIPLAESQARLNFYQQLESRAIREKRDREIQEDIDRYYGAPVQMQRWGPPPVGLPVHGFPVPPPLPSNALSAVPFIRRGNVIAAPPGGRNIEGEKIAETYGYPPMPGSRPGDTQRGQKRKRAARH